MGPGWLSGSGRPRREWRYLPPALTRLAIRALALNAELFARVMLGWIPDPKQAAVLLKISYKALLYKIRQYGIAQSRTTHRLSAGA